MSMYADEEPLNAPAWIRIAASLAPCDVRPRALSLWVFACARARAECEGRSEKEEKEKERQLRCVLSARRAALAEMVLRGARGWF